MTSIFASNIVREDYSYCRTNNLRVKAYTSEQMHSAALKRRGGGDFEYPPRDPGVFLLLCLGQQQTDT